MRDRIIPGIDEVADAARAQAQFDGLMAKYPERTWGHRNRFCRRRAILIPLLIDAIPDVAAPRRNRLLPAADLPDPIAERAGCSFAPRCGLVGGNAGRRPQWHGGWNMGDWWRVIIRMGGTPALKLHHCQGRNNRPFRPLVRRKTRETMPVGRRWFAWQERALTILPMVRGLNRHGHPG